MSKLDKAQKAFAFFISSTTNEGAVAFDKLRELGASLDDVAYQNTDGSWLTRYGSIPFSMGSGSIDSVDLEQHLQERQQRAESESRQKAESERQRQERTHHEREARQAAERWRRECDEKIRREKEAEHKHYADIVEHAKSQAEKHEAFNRGDGYLGADGEYHLYSEMKWHY